MLVVHSAAPLLTAVEAAALLGLKPQTVRRLVAAGSLPAVHPTGTRNYRFNPDVIALVACGSWTPRSA